MAETAQANKKVTEPAVQAGQKTDTIILHVPLFLP
jgi:hypothetical protein